MKGKTKVKKQDMRKLKRERGIRTFKTKPENTANLSKP